MRQQLNTRSIRRFAARMLLPLWFATTLPGCNYFILASYLIGGPPSIEPDFDIMTHESMTDKDVTVAVVCYAPTELKWDFSEIDYEISKYVTRKLAAKEIKVIDPDYVHAWLDKNPNWDKPEEIGAVFETTYVIHIELEDFSLYEKNSPNLYRGRADAGISVWKMDEDDTGEKIYSKSMTSQYPLIAPRSTSEVSFLHFKREYLTRLSEEIGRLFYETYNGEDIPDAT